MFIVASHDATTCKDITCARFECVTFKSRGDLEKAVAASRKLVAPSGQLQVSSERMNNTRRDKDGRILMGAPKRSKGRRASSQKKQRIVYCEVLGVGGINNKNVGMVRRKTRKYSGY